MFPENARMVFCIGAQKAGTTWLYHAFGRSDDIHFSPNKELHYFDVIAGRAQQVLDLRISAATSLAQRLVAKTGPQNGGTLRQLAEITSLLSIYSGATDDHEPYLSYLLRGYLGQRCVCDITPAYAILDRETFRDMGEIGQAQFIFVMRDPVERLWSQIRMAVSASDTGDTTFQDACEARGRLLLETTRIPKIERADYKRTMTELEAAIPANRIKYVFYETLFCQQTINSLCDFLGISPITALQKQRSNPGRKARLPDDLRAAFRSVLDPQYRFIHARFGSEMPTEWTRSDTALKLTDVCPE